MPRKSMTAALFFQLALWQEPLNAQPPQEPPQEQEPFPFFLPRIPVMMIARKITAIIAAMINVGQFMAIPPKLFIFYFYRKNVLVIFVFSKEHE